MAPPHYKVTVIPVRPGSRAGLIGQGVTDGHRWTAIMSADGRDGVMLSGRGLTAVLSYQSFAQEFAANPATITVYNDAGIFWGWKNVFFPDVDAAAFANDVNQQIVPQIPLDQVAVTGGQDQTTIN